jgi:hypothetical protein
MIKYYAFKTVTEDMPFEEQFENQAYNISILADGVRGVECLFANREPTRGERLDYTQFAPDGSFISTVEEYKNGAKNLHIRSISGWKHIGVITIRPMLPYNAKKEYKTLDFKKENS